MRRLVEAGVSVLLLVVLLAGCSPHAKEMRVDLEEAAQTFAEATDNGARQKAPYHCRSAELYLEMAFKEMERGNLENAALLADRALKYAREALYITIIYRSAQDSESGMDEGGDPL